MVLLGEGGETKYETNINFLLEEFGIMVNNGTCCISLTSSLHDFFISCSLISLSAPVIADVVVRNVFYKYLHPKEALVSDGVLNRFVTGNCCFLVCCYICVCLG